jgi:hypothetical protein
MIKFEAWEKDSWTKAHINYAHDCWKAAQEAVLADLEREVEDRITEYTMSIDLVDKDEPDIAASLIGLRGELKTVLAIIRLRRRENEHTGRI